MNQSAPGVIRGLIQSPRAKLRRHAQLHGFAQPDSQLPNDRRRQ